MDILMFFGGVGLLFVALLFGMAYKDVFLIKAITFRGKRVSEHFTVPMMLVAALLLFYACSQVSIDHSGVDDTSISSGSTCSMQPQEDRDYVSQMVVVPSVEDVTKYYPPVSYKSVPAPSQLRDDNPGTLKGPGDVSNKYPEMVNQLELVRARLERVKAVFDAEDMEGVVIGRSILNLNEVINAPKEYILNGYYQYAVTVEFKGIDSNARKHMAMYLRNVEGKDGGLFFSAMEGILNTEYSAEAYKALVMKEMRKEVEMWPTLYNMVEIKSLKIERITVDNYDRLT